MSSGRTLHQLPQVHPPSMNRALAHDQFWASYQGARLLLNGEQLCKHGYFLPNQLDLHFIEEEEEYSPAVMQGIGALKIWV